MAFSDNSYQVTGKVCPPSLPMTMLLHEQWTLPPVLPGVLQSFLVESPAQETRINPPESLCAVVAQAQVLLSTNEGYSMSSVVSLPYYFCNFCDHHTDSRALLLKHLAQKHVFQCNLCNFSSLNRCSLIQHQLRAHIDAEELSPILSTKFVQVNLPQVQRTLQNNDLFSGRSPQQHHARDDSVSQVSSATGHHENNFLLPSPQQEIDNEDHSSVSTTQHESSQVGENFLTPERNNTNQTEPIPHFLDVGHSSVSSSNLSPQTHNTIDSSVSQDNSVTVSKKTSVGSIVANTSSAIASACCSDSPTDNDACSLSRGSLSGDSQKQKLHSRDPDNFLIDNSGHRNEEPQALPERTKLKASSENGQKKKKYDILRGLLIGESSEKVGSYSSPAKKQFSKSVQYLHCSSAAKESESKVNEPEVSPAVSLHERAQLQRASDMSLKELLMQPSTSGHRKCSGQVETYTTRSISGVSEFHSSVSDNHEAIFNSKAKSLPPNNCIASEMLRTLSQNVSGSENQNCQDVGALARSLYPSKTSGACRDGTGTQDTPYTSREENGGSRKSHRLKKKCVYLDSASLSDEGYANEISYSGIKKLALKRQRDENEDTNDDDDDDVEYIYENDKDISFSEDSEDSSTDSGGEERRRIKCKRLKLGMSHRDKYENLGMTLTCLHCSFTNGNRHILRNHLRVCHPLCVPFAETSLKSGKKTIMYFCQGFNSRCSFASSKASEIFSHIKLCYVGLLDGFNSELQDDFSSVLSSLGIASKLMDSRPSTFYCLRCDYTKHSLQPIVEHVMGKHAGSVTGILHVTIGIQEPKHTKVHMVCLACKTEVPAKEWRFHPCRVHGKKRERATWKEEDHNNEKFSSKIPMNHPVKSIDQVRYKENFLEKMNLSKTVSSESDGFVSSAGLKSALADKEIVVKEENFVVPEVETSPVVEVLNMKEPDFLKKHSKEIVVKEENCAVPEVDTSSEVDVSNMKEPDLVKNNTGIATSLLGKQMGKDSSMCVISSCFSMNPNFDSKSPLAASSQSITESLLTSPTKGLKFSTSSVLPLVKTTTESRSSLQGAGTTFRANSSFSKNPDTRSPTSVLHSLLVSDPPDISSTQALNLLQNLLSSSSSSGTGKTMAETPTHAAYTVGQSREQSLSLTSSVLPSPSSQAKSKQPNHSSSVIDVFPDLNIASNSTVSKNVKSSDSPITVKSETNFHADDATIVSMVYSEKCSDLTSQPVKREGHEHHQEVQGPQAPLQETSAQEKKLLGDCQGSSKDSHSSSLLPFVANPSLSQPSSHLKPLSATTPLTSSSASPVQDSLGAGLFPATSSAPLHPSPFTNLLRGLLSMSQKKDKETAFDPSQEIPINL
ncbi:hypothetical protein RRG08_059802 [Elysia crispata]|uniref:C2H2-type domain-containing protein n=1 Tax=Elysia crispata TaxID=231223 RepID=A0AAE1EG14_9GAST|nr:hypothetical protein RRG08_059802 [Elysia crispata]